LLVKYICSAADYKSAIEKQQRSQNKEVMKNAEADLAEILAEIIQKHPELTEIVQAWPDLPEKVKSAILGMIDRQTEREKSQ